MIFVVMLDERKKINRKKTQEEERRDLSLSLSLSLFASLFTTRLSSCELFGFVCSKHSIKVYSYHLHDDAEKRIISKRKKKQK